MAGEMPPRKGTKRSAKVFILEKKGISTIPCGDQEYCIYAIFARAQFLGLIAVIYLFF